MTSDQITASTLVVGASGATGKRLVEQLLDREINVKAIIRPSSNLPDHLKNHPKLTIIHANILELTDAELTQHLIGCNAIASCLGHNLSFKGLFGQPRRLVTDSVRQLCHAVKTLAPDQPVKFILMNTTGNHHHDIDDPISFKQKCVITLIRLLLPPHSDNEQAAAVLQVEIGQQHDHIEWVVVRPDSLTDDIQATNYTLHTSPIRSAIFDPGKTSRINVGHFMAELVVNDQLWEEWVGQMPVIYNQ